jgi:hypothetical protein
MVDIKDDICMWKGLVDSVSNLTAVFSCHEHWSLYFELLAAAIKTIKCFLKLSSRVGLA